MVSGEMKRKRNYRWGTINGRRVHLKRHIYIVLPDDMVIPFNRMMRKHGFNDARGFILHVLRELMKKEGYID